MVGYANGGCRVSNATLKNRENQVKEEAITINYHLDKKPIEEKGETEPFILHTHNCPAKLFGKTIYILLQFSTSVVPRPMEGGGSYQHSNPTFLQ